MARRAIARQIWSTHSRQASGVRARCKGWDGGGETQEAGGVAMSRILLVIAASALMSGCAALGVDTNADPTATSASDPQASADLSGSVDRSVSASPKIARPISTAKTVPSSYAVPSYYVEKGCKAASGTA